MRWLSAPQALQLLQVRPQTLYAQVSRKVIRARPDPSDVRRSLYNEQDVLRQAQRRAGRPRDETVASAAIGWGAPVLVTQISTVAHGRLNYRGRDAVQLASHATLEDVAGLLWGQGTLVEFGVSSMARPTGQVPSDDPIRRALICLADRAATDPSPMGQSLPWLHQQAQLVLQTVAQALIGDAVAPGAIVLPLHERLARAWGFPEAADQLRRVLVLLADHELNASTFATRVCASTGASLSACVLSGLSTLTGPLHGGACAQVLSLVDASLRDGPVPVLESSLRRGSLYPAFGHPLYPNGDVRARALLDEFTLPPGFAALQTAALKLTGEHPTIDFALAAMVRNYGWGSQAPLSLFALSRCVGWLAHALEQVTTGSLIRPRARYVGVDMPPVEFDAPIAAAMSPSAWHPG